MDVDEAIRRVKEDIDRRCTELEKDEDRIRAAREHAQRTGDRETLRRLVQSS